MKQILIANIRDLLPPSMWPAWYVYVGRENKGWKLAESPLANPYKVGMNYCGYYTREEVVAVYSQKVLRAYNNVPVSEEVIAELARLRALFKRHGKLVLVCWCAPKRCHAEAIREFLNDPSA